MSRYFCFATDDGDAAADPLFQGGSPKRYDMCMWGQSQNLFQPASKRLLFLQDCKILSVVPRLHFPFIKNCSPGSAHAEKRTTNVTSPTQIFIVEDRRLEL